MGIPKFYRWLSERYPLVNQPISETSVPILDNLYLDMNGIIHNCTHGNDPGTKLTENEMIQKVFIYLERLFAIIQPQKLLFMAIDGVAPRAKMNQQRSRRFKSAKERQEAEAELIRKGEMVEGEGFDSNCITPGTAFMGRLNDHLRFFIRKKIAEDRLWQKPAIILSGHDVPGEGEHKIMEAIRMAKKGPDYAPNQTHCMYGLDADLIMLSLVTHEPHFCLLREVVSFGGACKGRPTREVLDNPCAEHFVLFHISLLRDYLEMEFKSAMGVPWFNVERVVDDFVLFCMLIGNDFLPALPTLDVNEGALDKIFAIYKKVLPELGGYLTDGGDLNRPRLERLFKELAALETETLAQRAADAEDFDSKRARGNRGFGDGRAPGPASARWSQPRHPVSELDVEDAEEANLSAGLSKAILGDPGVEDLELMVALEGEEEPVAAAPTMMSKEARQLFLSNDPDAGLYAWKERYYSEKLEIKDQRGRRAVVESYLAGLLWVLDYYYRGVASWTWFYPYHYSPMCSDLVALDAIEVDFELGTPFLPFQQLLAVLPAASAELLPKPYKHLMTSPTSPIISFYPETFRIDLEGKRADWEGIVLVPFIDEERLLAAERTITRDQLTTEERSRNVLGSILIFTLSGNSGEREFCTSSLPGVGNVTVYNSRCVRQPPPPPLPKGEKGFVPVLVKGTKQGKAGPPGFPTLKTVESTCHLAAVGIDVLGQASKKESLIIALADPLQGQDLAPMVVANGVLNHHCWIRWPYLVEARVEGVSNAKEEVVSDGSVIRHTPVEETEWAQKADKLKRDFLIKRGLELGNCNVLLHVRPCQGLMRRTDGTIEKRFAKDVVQAPLQATLRRNLAQPDPRLDPETAAALSDKAFRENTRALFVGSYNYGSLATILSAPDMGLNKQGDELANGAKSVMLRVCIEPAPPAAVEAASTAKRIMASVKVHYEPGYSLARKLGMSSRTVGKITGNFYVRAGDVKTDLGLCVKHGGRNLCVPDYVQPMPEGNGWLYSPALLQVLADYKKKFPWAFAFMERTPEAGLEADVGDVLPTLTPAAQLEALASLTAYIKKLPLSRRPLVKAHAKVAPEDTIRALQMAMPTMPAQPLPPIELENVAPWLLLPPSQPRSHVTAALAGGVFELGDRVASLSATGTPPLGFRGTVVGVHDDACEVLFDREFPGGTDLFGRCSGKCGYLMPGDQLLNTSKPQVITVAGSLAPRIVRKRSDNIDAAPPKQQVPQGPPPPAPAVAGNAVAITLQSVQNGERPVRMVIRTPERARPRPHMPLAPSSPSARGFGVGGLGMGRGRPARPPDARGNPFSHPSSQPLGANATDGQDFLNMLNNPPPPRHAVGAASATTLPSPGDPRGIVAGRQLLARIQGDATPTSSAQLIQPLDNAPPPTPGQKLLACLQAGGDGRSSTPPAAAVPLAVHHSPFGHIQPPLQTAARPFPPYAPPPGLPMRPQQALTALSPLGEPIIGFSVPATNPDPPGGPAAPANTLYRNQPHQAAAAHPAPPNPGHALLQQIQGRPAPHPVPLPPPVTLPPPVAPLPRPAAASGSALLEQLRAGPAVPQPPPPGGGLTTPATHSNEPGKAILAQLQSRRPTAPYVLNGIAAVPPRPPGKAAQHAQLSAAAQNYLEAKRNKSGALTPNQAPSGETSPTGASQPISISAAAIAAREAASAALRGAEDVVHSHSGSDDPTSPWGLDGPARSHETPSMLTDRAILKARRAAKAALRGTAVKEADQKSPPTAQQYAELSAAAEAHLRAAAALKGVLGIGGGPRQATTQQPGLPVPLHPPEVESEASIKAKEAAATALKGLLARPPLATPQVSVPPLPGQPPQPTPAAAAAAASPTSTSPADFWNKLMK